MNTTNPIADALQSATSQLGGRRNFLRTLGLAGAGTAGLISTTPQARAGMAGLNATDAAVLNFALNLEYLEAEYYLHATTGKGLEFAGIAVTGSGGEAAGNVATVKKAKVKFDTNAFEDYANEIALDEVNHVRFLREALAANGAAVVARPEIDLQESFNILGSLIGLESFDPFENEINFLIGAFIFEDVGVTAYKGASPLITNKGILEAAAGILGVEAYHAGIIRTVLYAQGKSVRRTVAQISKVRQSLDATPGINSDQTLTVNGKANLVPTDGNSLIFSRTTRQVLNIVYGGVNATQGLFFPQGLNGAIK